MDKGTDYEWLLIGSNDRQNAWVLSKLKALPKETLDLIMRKLEENKFDVHKLTTIKYDIPKL